MHRRALTVPSIKRQKSACCPTSNNVFLVFLWCSLFTVCLSLLHSSLSLFYFVGSFPYCFLLCAPAPSATMSEGFFLLMTDGTFRWCALCQNGFQRFFFFFFWVVGRPRLPTLEPFNSAPRPPTPLALLDLYFCFLFPDSEDLHRNHRSLSFPLSHFLILKVSYHLNNSRWERRGHWGPVRWLCAPIASGLYRRWRRPVKLYNRTWRRGGWSKPRWDEAKGGCETVGGLSPGRWPYIDPQWFVQSRQSQCGSMTHSYLAIIDIDDPFIVSFFFIDTIIRIDRYSRKKENKNSCLS